MNFDYPISIVVERQLYDEWTGDPVGEPTPHTIDDCAVAPRTGGETNNLGTAVIVGLSLFAPYASDIVSTDRIYLPGDPQAWEVDGEPGNWRSPFTDWRPGCQVALTRQRGA